MSQTTRLLTYNASDKLVVDFDPFFLQDFSSGHSDSADGESCEDTVLHDVRDEDDSDAEIVEKPKSIEKENDATSQVATIDANNAPKNAKCKSPERRLGLYDLRKLLEMAAMEKEKSVSRNYRSSDCSLSEEVSDYDARAISYRDEDSHGHLSGISRRNSPIYSIIAASLSRKRSVIDLTGDGELSQDGPPKRRKIAAKNKPYIEILDLTDDRAKCNKKTNQRVEINLL
jgi:hypothetical protein